MKRYLVLIPVILTVLLASCAKDLSSSSYEDYNAGSGGQVYHGIVVSMRQVKVKGNSGVGGAAGAATGAVLGSSLGGGRGQIVSGIAGSVLGGVAGNAIDKGVNSQKAIEYIVQLQDQKRTISVVQAPSNLRTGDHVLVIDGPRVRIELDNSYRPPAVAKASPTKKAA